MTELMQTVEDCEERDSKLTDWERGFLDSIRKLLESGRGLTDPQTEKLDAIWERVTSSAKGTFKG